MKKLLVLCFPLLWGCGEVYVPKPKGYPSISFPEKHYIRISQTNCPFEFDIPVYAKLNRDSISSSEPCWLNLDFPDFNATIHLTYKDIIGKNEFIEIQNDTRKLVFKHAIKAEEIFETPLANIEKNYFGMLYDLTGNAATPLQFYLTDSSKHYIRGVLYFNTKTNTDSIAPVQQFITQDIYKLINTFSWR